MKKTTQNNKPAYIVDENVIIWKQDEGWCAYHVGMKLHLGATNGYIFKTKKQCAAFANHIVENIDMNFDNGDDFWLANDQEMVHKVLVEGYEGAMK